MFEVLTTQVTWSAEDIKKIWNSDYSALTASEWKIVDALKEGSIERLVKPFQLRLKPGVDAGKIEVFLTGLDDKVGDGSHNLKAYVSSNIFLFNLLSFDLQILLFSFI